MSDAETVRVDPFDPRRAHRAEGRLAAFNRAGVLGAADVHVAGRLGALLDTRAEPALLAAAFAVRAPRLGHVYVDLATIAETATVETEESADLTQLDWPAPAAWVEAVAASGLAAVGEGPAVGEARPLRLVGSHLYLDRYWREELRVAADLTAFGADPAVGVDEATLRAGLRRLFPEETADGRQELAAATAVLRRFAVVAGGPGTGKTTTVARIVALLLEQAAAAGRSAPLIALAAPTGKAAARLEEAVHVQAPELDVDGATRAALLDLTASTLHRLLGARPGSRSRFRHARGNRLPHDAVIVDEASMVSLSLMGRLVEAVRPEARLVLVGDPDQLTSIEAGAVLGDVVGPAADRPLMRAPARAALGRVTGRRDAASAAPAGVVVGDGIVGLTEVHRFGGAIATLAGAIRAADADAVIACLAAGTSAVRWLALDVAESGANDLEPVREAVVTAAVAALAAAEGGDGQAALKALGGFRLLCAHRHGPYGASQWTATVERWLAAAIPGFDPRREWYLGRPLLVTENDYGLRLYNGDTGVVVAAGADRLACAFERRGGVTTFSPTRLGAVDTVYAMTVHKAQGSQFDTAAIVLPLGDSPILTRELLYTALTRARERLLVVGTEAAIRRAVARPAARASALRGRLWHAGDGGPH